MKVLWSWLKEVSGLEIEPEEAARRLTLAGLEVDSVLPIDEEKQSDALLDVNVTPNRPDCLSVAGLGRELRVLFGRGRPATTPVKLKEGSVRTAGRASVKIACPRECPRYTGRVILNVSIGPSSPLIAYRLQKMGLRPINNVVDVTNYILLEMGQPLHAFDLALIEGGKIIVRRQGGPGNFITLDGQQRELADGDVLICDAERPVALGGIMGGMNTEIRATTRDVFLESAYFDPATIRRTAKRLKILTESSFRFERGVDVEGVPVALDRAAALLQENAGGEICPGALDVYPKPIKRKRLRFDVAAVERHTGVKLQAKPCEKMFGQLGMKVRRRSPNTLDVTPPPWRVDLDKEIDLVEEAIRICGYEHIPSELPPTRVRSAGPGVDRALEREIRQRLAASGFQEIITPSFSSRHTLEVLAGRTAPPDMEPIEILNPLSEEQGYVRPSLLPSLIGVMAYNLRHGRKSVKLFEIGSVYLYKKSNRMVEESPIACAGLAHVGGAPRESFLELKGGIETLLDGLGVPSVAFRDKPSELYAPEESIGVFSSDTLLGSMGLIRKNVLGALDLDAEAWVAELDVRALLGAWHPVRHIASFSRFPSVVRDLALVVDEHVTCDGLLAEIRGQSVPFLESIEPYDEYRGSQVAPGKKSLALRLTFSRQDRTFTDEEIHQALGLLAEALKSKGAGLRETNSGLYTGSRE
ncbi:MAG: phenylalanine--tRNA ligase subunit beta [Nitrospirae bacterium]|nr:phenylalanine--tRNA ligase subunit beta [Nitrospirota bacterium]